jgi:hypothetical protein
MPERCFRYVGTERAISGPLSMQPSGGQLVLTWVNRLVRIRAIEPARLMPILFTIVTLVYVILVGASSSMSRRRKKTRFSFGAQSTLAWVQVDT